ncbi:hypothetical protein TgHK011_004048 [Trichoderma gracile]|nr:hypothetical protein TgHK011_004048 [Trichoderma gracile]
MLMLHLNENKKHVPVTKYPRRSRIVVGHGTHLNWLHSLPLGYEVLIVLQQLVKRHQAGRMTMVLCPRLPGSAAELGTTTAFLGLTGMGLHHENKVPRGSTLLLCTRSRPDASFSPTQDFQRP